MPAPSIEPTPDQLRELAALGGTDGDGPIVMLNLLRFKEDGGRESYERYAAAVATHLTAVGGRVHTLADTHHTVIGPENEAWDLMILVEYPSRHAFLTMIADPDYQRAHEHRAAAISDSRLICCSAARG